MIITVSFGLNNRIFNIKKVGKDLFIDSFFININKEINDPVVKVIYDDAIKSRRSIHKSKKKKDLIYKEARIIAALAYAPYTDIIDELLWIFLDELIAAVYDIDETSKIWNSEFSVSESEIKFKKSGFSISSILEIENLKIESIRTNINKVIKFSNE